MNNEEEEFFASLDELKVVDLDHNDFFDSDKFKNVETGVISKLETISNNDNLKQDENTIVFQNQQTFLCLKKVFLLYKKFILDVHDR